MSGLLGGVLPAIYSQADRAKRYLGGLLSDPVGRMQQAGGQAVDDLNKIGLLSEQAFSDPKNPMKMQDNAASRQLVDTYLNSVLNFAPVGMTVKGPQAEALEKARKNAVKMLGLPENNTPMDRARALGFEDGSVHFSRHGVDANVLDSGQYAKDPFDAVGTHVGSPDAALDRFRNTVATTDQIKGTTYPLMIKKGEQFVSPETGGAWTEDALNAALLDRGGYATARETYPSLNAKLRKDIFKGSGYDSIPYVNDVEGKGTVSHIVPPWNIRSRFAAFDPARINESDLLGRADPRLLAILGIGAGGAAYYGSDK